VSSLLGTRDLIGHARVSTDEQNLDLQLDALEAAGCKRVFRELGSASLRHRPQLDACVDYLRMGDTLVVWRLDRLGRGLKHLIESIDQLHAREVGFRSLTEMIDSTTPAGRLQLHIFGALAEFEREIIRERARAGVAAARARGRLGRRPSSLSGETCGRQGDAGASASGRGDRCCAGCQPGHDLSPAGGQHGSTDLGAVGEARTGNRVRRG
jgi:DNA invertase Pin-like site-specific DNA recombinase